MTTTLPAARPASKPTLRSSSPTGRRWAAAPLGSRHCHMTADMRKTRVSMQTRLTAAIMAKVVTERDPTNTPRNQCMTGTAELHARLRRSARVGGSGYYAYLVPAGGLRLAERPV